MKDLSTIESMKSKSSSAAAPAKKQKPKALSSRTLILHLLLI